MRVFRAVLLVASLVGIGAIGYGQASAEAGKVAARPLYRDPPFDAPTDPVFCYNAEQKKWFMYYTARRAAASERSMASGRWLYSWV